MVNVSRVRFTSGAMAGKTAIQEVDQDSGLIALLSDDEEAQRLEVGCAEFELVEELGQYDGQDSDAYWGLVG